VLGLTWRPPAGFVINRGAKMPILQDLTDPEVNAALVALISRNIIENKFPGSARVQRLKLLLAKLDSAVEVDELPEWHRELHRDGAAIDARTVFNKLCDGLRLNWRAATAYERNLRNCARRGINLIRAARAPTGSR
jgi:hypothetical protein